MKLTKERLEILKRIKAELREPLFEFLEKVTKADEEYGNGFAQDVAIANLLLSIYNERTTTPARVVFKDQHGDDFED